MPRFKVWTKEAQRELLALFDLLKADPFQGNDYHDEVQYAGPNAVKLVGAFAVVFYVDHAVKEVKILDILSADDIE